MKTHLAYVTVSSTLILLLGCSTPANSIRSDQLITLHLGMTKTEVQKVIGPPTVARGSIRNKYEQVVDVWEYTVALPNQDTAGQAAGKAAITVLTFGAGAVLYEGQLQPYWLYFLNDELTRWGAAGDWSTEPQRIYEFKFEPSVR